MVPSEAENMLIFTQTFSIGSPVAYMIKECVDTCLFIARCLSWKINLNFQRKERISICWWNTCLSIRNYHLNHCYKSIRRQYKNINLSNVFFFTVSNSAQVKLLLTLHWGFTPGRAGGLCRVPGSELRIASCKASIQLSALSLWLFLECINTYFSLAHYNAFHQNKYVSAYM